MSQGSVKQAIARKADVVQGNMHRLIVAMDAAKVRAYIGLPEAEIAPELRWGHRCCFLHLPVAGHVCLLRRGPQRDAALRCANPDVLQAVCADLSP